MPILFKAQNGLEIQQKTPEANGGRYAGDAVPAGWAISNFVLLSVT
jgi:hypothetical protein